MSDKPNAQARPESPMDKFKRLKMSALRGVPPVEVAAQLFPNKMVEEEVPGRSWKVRLPEGHLHIDGQVFTLLEDPKNKRYRGGGGIDAHCILAGKMRDDRTAFQEAVKAMTQKFFPWVEDKTVPFSEKLRRLETAVVELTANAEKTKNHRSVGPVELPDKSVNQRDSHEVFRYLTERRGLPGQFVKDAMSADAVYAARLPSKLPGRQGPLNAIFPLVEYRTGNVVSYSRRSIFGDTKKNKGAKMTAGYIIGDFRNATSLFVVESPIEAKSRYVLLKEQLKDQSLLNECCIVGVNGTGRQTELLAVAKKLGYQQVFAGYNNDHAGRSFNQQLIADAKIAGLNAAPDIIPGGEISCSVFPHERTKAAHDRVLAFLKTNNVPSKQLEGATRENFQFPNSSEACDLIREIEKARIGYHSVRGANEPSLVAARDELARQAKDAGKPTTLKEDQENASWRLSILRDDQTDAIVNIWKNGISRNPVVQKDPRMIEVDFVALIDFSYVNKDWNDMLKEHTSISRGSKEGVLGRLFGGSLDMGPQVRAAIVNGREAKRLAKDTPTPELEVAVPGL